MSWKPGSKHSHVQRSRTLHFKPMSIRVGKYKAALINSYYGNSNYIHAANFRRTDFVNDSMIYILIIYMLLTFGVQTLLTIQ